MDLAQKDPNVMTFMMQMVQEKHGDNVDNNFLQQEADKLYEEFGDRLVNYFEPMLTDEQKGQFDQLVGQGVDQDKLLEFLVGAIENLEQRILEVLMQFKNEYLVK
jgi:hypothetical protein